MLFINYNNHLNTLIRYIGASQIGIIPTTKDLGQNGWKIAETANINWIF